MKTAKYAMGSGGLLTLLLVLGMQFSVDPEIQGFGPEVDGLRMGLDITTQRSHNTDTYQVRIRIRNTSDQPILLTGHAPYEGKLMNYTEWLKAEICFLTYPELIPPSAQTAGIARTSPNPQTTIAPGKEFTVSWTSQGRYLKTEHYYNTTPYFPSDGLYGVRGRIGLRTDKEKVIQLYSNECAVSVGGSVALRYQPGGHTESKTLHYTVKMFPGIVRLLAEINDHVLFATDEGYGQHVFYDVSSNRLKRIGGTLSPYSLGTYRNRLYVSGYPGSQIIEYDFTRPLGLR